MCYAACLCLYSFAVGLASLPALVRSIDRNDLTGTLVFSSLHVVGGSIAITAMCL